MYLPRSREDKKGKTGNTGIVVLDDGTATYSYDAAKEKLKELMQEDPKVATIQDPDPTHKRERCHMKMAHKRRRIAKS